VKVVVLLTIDHRVPRIASALK